MRFAPGDEAVALREATAAVLAAGVTPDVVRAGWPEGDVSRVDAAWQALGKGSLLGVLVPEPDGGLGLDEAALVVMAEELGRSGLPAPVAETAAGAPLLAAAGDPALEDVLAGRVTLTARLDGGTLVPFGQRADLVLLGDRRGVRLYEPAELELEPVATVDGSRAVARVRSSSGGRSVCDDPELIELAWQRGVLATCGLLTGLAGRMLDTTVSYVKQREQFGVPVGSFQAVKHALASALLALQFARPPAAAAGWALAQRIPEAPTHVSMAKVVAADAAHTVSRTAIQCHGAIAYTTEYDLHLYAKRVWALAPAWGSVAGHRERLATALHLAGVAGEEEQHG